MRRHSIVVSSLVLAACFSPDDAPETGSSAGSSSSSSAGSGSTTSTTETASTSSSPTSTAGVTTEEPGTESSPTSGDPDTSGTATETGDTPSCDVDPSVCGKEETCVADACVVVPAGMVPVPEGPFQMGCNGDVDDTCNEDEFPYHEVFLDSFAIGRTEVSQGQYQACVDGGKCTAPGSGGECLQDPVGDDMPAVCVSWFAARDYCEFVGGRLPTEAEWEKAARGVDGARFPWGDGEPDCNLAAYNDCTGREPVESNPGGASPYGALNMAGNVYEWTSDWYQSTYYVGSPAKNPQGPDSGDRRTIRSASSNYNADSMRASFRGPDYEINEETGTSVVGIRCAADL